MCSLMSFAALSGSTSRSNCAITSETPSVDVEVSVSRPLTVLTASSTFSVTSVSTARRRRAGVRRDDRDQREVDLGELVDAEPAVADEPDDDEHEDQHASRRPAAGRRYCDSHCMRLTPRPCRPSTIWSVTLATTLSPLSMPWTIDDLVRRRRGAELDDAILELALDRRRTRATLAALDDRVLGHDRARRLADHDVGLGEHAGHEVGAAGRAWPRRSASASCRSRRRRATTVALYVLSGCATAVERRPSGPCWIARDRGLGHRQLDAQRVVVDEREQRAAGRDPLARATRSSR